MKKLFTALAGFSLGIMLLMLVGCSGSTYVGYSGGYYGGPYGRHYHHGHYRATPARATVGRPANMPRGGGGRGRR
jgi:hypothetical protein